MALVDVTDIDLDQLLEVHVSSPSKKEQSLSDVPSAITVIRGEALVRMGVTTLAEALRCVPGVQVARVSAHSWAISVRGFNDTFSNKLLVLIDGRSVYSPIHSGVFWDVQDVMVEDIDRIEVIRGPGGALWGANAINGVINVITKRASETRGGLVTAGAGSEERAFGDVRYGLGAGTNGSARVYARYANHDDSLRGDDPERRARDGWFLGRAGFRADWTPGGARDRIGVSGDYYKGQEKEDLVSASLDSPTGTVAVRDRARVHGGNVLFRWDREIDPVSSLSLHAYYDHTYRDSVLFQDVIRTADLDFQHRFRPFSGHDVIWGLGYRSTWSELDGNFVFSVDPPRRRNDLYSVFIQDEIALAGDRLHLTVGSKFEHNDFSGFEAQPSLRLFWKPADGHSAWISASRAVRTPSILDVDGSLTPLVIPGPLPLIVTIFGKDDFRTESLIAYEAGYRVRAAQALSFDLAVFRNHYDHLRSGVVGAAFVATDPPPTRIVIPIFLRNELRGATAGAELTSNLRAASWWLIQGSYALLRMSMTEADIAGRNPHHTIWIRSAMDLPSGFTLDLTGRYVSALPTLGVEDYAEADARLAWRSPARRFEAAIVGQNLVHRSHPEFETPDKRTELQRGVYASVTWRY